MIETSYHIIAVKWQESLRYYIWIQAEETDGVVLNAQGQILLFRSVMSLKTYTDEKGINLYDENVTHFDFDKIEEWTKKMKEDIDCPEFLNTWNMFTDMGDSVGIKFEGYKRDELTDTIYDKLFFGNNLSSMKPEDRPDYEPIWTKQERKRLSIVLKHGLAIFKQKCVMHL